MGIAALKPFLRRLVLRNGCYQDFEGGVNKQLKE